MIRLTPISPRTDTLFPDTTLFRSPSTFGRLHVLTLLPELLSRYPGLQVDLVLSDALRSMVDDRIDLAISLSQVNDTASVVRRVAGKTLVCAGSRPYFTQRGVTKTPTFLHGANRSEERRVENEGVCR